MARRIKDTSDKYIRVKGYWYDEASVSTDLKEYTVKKSRHSGNGFLVNENGCLVDGEMVEIVEILGPATILSPIEALSATHPTISKLREAFEAASWEGDRELYKQLVAKLIAALGEATSVAPSYFSNWLGEGRVEIQLDVIQLQIEFSEDRMATVFGVDGDPVYQHYMDDTISEFVSVVGMHIVSNVRAVVESRLESVRRTLDLARALKIEGI